MKTVMQEVIEWINETQTHNVFDVQDKLIELLEKERQQIIDAFDEGAMYEDNRTAYLDAKDYYNNTFKTI